MRIIAVAVLLVIALAGCGGDDNRQAVDDLFERLDSVQRSGDAEAACERVFVIQEFAGEAEGEAEGEGEPEAEREGEREGGGEESPEACREAFEAGQATRAAQVSSLKSTLQSVDFDGDTAVAHVRSKVVRADGSSFENDYERDLVRRDGDWRIRISPEG